MKLLMSEYSAGFSNYSNILCNNLFDMGVFDKIIYLTPLDNSYFDIINDDVDKRKVFKTYSADKSHKKGSIKWLVNRMVVSMNNCIIRNKIIKQEKPDVILIQVSHSTFDRWFIRFIDKKVYKVLTIHDVIVPTKSFSWSMTSLKKMYDCADCLVVHSETNKRQLMDIFNISEKKIVVIPHGMIRGHKFISKEECRKRLNIKTNSPVLLFYGDMRKSKGLDVLLESVKGLDCHLLISGTPPYGETFEEYQRLIDIGKLSVTLILEYTSDEFRDVLFQASDYLVLPYKEFYSQSGVFMQAIQYHLPIIATDVSSFKEFIDRYNIGFIAKKNDVKNLREVILNAISSKYNFEEGMKKAEEENCWEISSKKYAEVIMKGE